MGIRSLLHRHLFRLSQVWHVGGELASYPLLLVISQVVAIEGEEGFGGLAILVGGAVEPVPLTPSANRWNSRYDLPHLHIPVTTLIKPF